MRQARQWIAGGAAVVVAMAVAFAVASTSGGLAPVEANGTSEYFIVVTKVLEPSHDLGRFDLFVDGEPVFENAGNGDHGGVLSIGETEQTSITVSEAVGSQTPAGVTLGNYSTTITCVALLFELSPPSLELEGGPSELTNVIGPEEESFSGQGSSLTFDVPPGTQSIDCTVTNTRIVAPDCDGDGVSDELERLLGTDECNADTDGDGRSDGDELFIDGTDPRGPLLPSGDGGLIPSCPIPGEFSPPLGPPMGSDTTLTIFGGGTIGSFQDAIGQAGYTHATFTFLDGRRATLPSDPNDPTFFVFFSGLSDVEVTLTVTDTDTNALRGLEIPPCTPTLLSGDPNLIFADGFESGDVSSWSAIP